MVQEQRETWSEAVVSEQQFIEAGQKLEAWNTATDFLQLIANGRRPDVVFVTEGYIKQQPLALNYQLPELEHRADLDDLQPPPQLFWSVRDNMLHPARLLSRELCGCGSCGLGSVQQLQQRMACAQHEQVPLGVIERCKLLDVQYVSKQYMPQQDQDDNPFGEHQGQQPQQHSALTLRLTLQRLVDPQQQLLQHVQQQHCDKGNCLQESACCSRERSPDLIDHQQEEQRLQDQLRERTHNKAPQTDAWSNNQRALICSLEYPVFHLEGNDFIVPARVFDQGMADWSTLARNDEFTMEWDGTPCEGFVEGYRQRKLDDPFWGSPWRSIIIDWKEDPVNRETAPEDWWHGNPWEMQRLPSSSAAPAAAVVAAPWTQEGAAVAIAAARAAAAAEKAKQAKRASKKRKRANSWALDDAFFYDAGTIDDGSEPSDASFFYDDDPDDYIIRLSNRRPTQRQRSQRQQQQQRSASAPGGSSRQRHSAGGGAAAAAPRQRGGEVGDTEPAHTWGRELVGVPDNVCLICRKGSEKGELVSMHTGKAQQSCCRRYHVGCLLLLNAAGLRTVYLGKQQLKRHQQQQQQQNTRAGSSGAAAPAAAAAVAAAPGGGARSDGLLGELQQLLQQQGGSGVSQDLAAAVAEAEAAAVLHAKDELSLACPAHCCHGCGLNGKHEFLVWCCCCWVRTYHCRNCVPLGAEKVVLSGREYIRCPYCVAAKAPLPLQPPAMATAVPARAAAATALENEQLEDATTAAGAAEARAALDARAATELAAAAAAAARGVGAVMGSAEPDGPAHAAADAQLLVAAAVLNEHTAAATAPELAKAAAAADEIAAELAQQQLLLQWVQQQQQQDATPAGVLCEADFEEQQQGAHEKEPNSHAHTPDVFHIVSDEFEEQVIVIAASVRDDAAANAAQVPAAAVAAASDRLHCADSDPVRTMLLIDTQELEALQREIEELQQQLSVKQQQYEQKQQQLESKRQQLLLRQGWREPDAAADAKAGAAADDTADIMVATPVAAVDATVPADMLSTLDALAGAAEATADAAPENASAVAAAQADAAAAYTAAAAVAQAPDEHNPAAMPSWLQLSLEDRELRNPSWKLVPVNDEGGVAAEALQYVADAISRLPVEHQASIRTCYASSTAAAAGGSGNGGGESSSKGGSSEHALLLFAPHCHWLIGSREKAEAAKYKVSGSWAGCPVIHVETPDEGVFGVCFVTDHAARFAPASLPPPQQQQQKEEEDGGGSGTCLAAATSEGALARLVRRAEQRRPDVFLRCWKPVVQIGRQRQQQRHQDGDERGGRRGVRGEEWEVLVNGRTFPASIGRDGLKLQDGDVITVQGLQLKLVAV